MQLEKHSPYEDEIFLTSNKIQINDPRIFFLKAYIPLIEDNYEFNDCKSDDLFIVIANLL